MISRYLVAQNQGRRNALDGRWEWPSLREDYYMSRKLTLSSVIALVLCIGSLAAGEARLAHIFQDNMVLQRDAPVPVWGWADPGTTVDVAFAGQQVGS